MPDRKQALLGIKDVFNASYDYYLKDVSSTSAKNEVTGCGVSVESFEFIPVCIHQFCRLL